MNISRNSQKAPFAVLADNLRRRIEEKALKPGAMIGTEVNLAAESGLSRMTVRRAVQELVDAGLVERRAGRGIFVSEARSSVARSIRVLVGNLLWAPAVRVAQAVQDEAQKAGRKASVFDARGNLTAFLDELKALPDSGFAGAVIMSQHDAAFNRALVGLVAAEFPVVIVDQTLSDLPADSVSSDNRAGGRLAAGALLAAGHSRLAFLGDMAADTTAARAQGVADACAEALVPPPLRLAIPGQRFGDWEPAIRRSVNKLLNEKNRPTALVCSCDAVARIAMRALAAHGVAVPDEMSVTGFDDDPIAEWTSPALTTVRQDFAEMGHHAYALLNARLANPAAAPRHDDVAVTLIERDSIAPQSPTLHPASHSLHGATA